MTDMELIFMFIICVYTVVTIHGLYRLKCWDDWTDINFPFMSDEEVRQYVFDMERESTKQKF